MDLKMILCLISFEIGQINLGYVETHDRPRLRQDTTHIITSRNTI